MGRECSTGKIKTSVAFAVQSDNSKFMLGIKERWKLHLRPIITEIEEQAPTLQAILQGCWILLYVESLTKRSLH